jgi:hypothetical protein
MEIRPINNPTMASECGRKGHSSLSVNQKLEMMKFSKEGLSKDKAG